MDAHSPTVRGIPLMQVAAAVAALGVLANALAYLAPGLALLALPFLVGLWQARAKHGGGVVALALGGVAITAISVSYVVQAGDLSWPAADYLGVLVGGTAGAVAGALALSSLLHHHQPGHVTR
jgi:hypothetical protein